MLEKTKKEKIHMGIVVTAVVSMHVVGIMLIQGCATRRPMHTGNQTTQTPVPRETVTSQEEQVIRHPGKNANVILPPKSGAENRGSGAARVTPRILPKNTMPKTVKHSTPKPVAEKPASGGSEQTYTLQKGETLSHVATKYDLSWRELAQFNNISDPAKLRAGQTIRIPGSAVPTQSSKENMPAVPENESYTVQKGDYLGKIAKKHGLTVQELKQVNALSSDVIRVGQVLRIPGGATAQASKQESPKKPEPQIKKPNPVPPPKPPLKEETVAEVAEPAPVDPLAGVPGAETPTEATATPEENNSFIYTVEEGETIERIASIFLVSPSEILEFNGLPEDTKITQGMKLKIPDMQQ